LLTIRVWCQITNYLGGLRRAARQNPQALIDKLATVGNVDHLTVASVTDVMRRWRTKSRFVDDGGDEHNSSDSSAASEGRATQRQAVAHDDTDVEDAEGEASRSTWPQSNDEDTKSEDEVSRSPGEVVGSSRTLVLDASDESSSSSEQHRRSSRRLLSKQSALSRPPPPPLAAAAAAATPASHARTPVTPRRPLVGSSVFSLAFSVWMRCEQNTDDDGRVVVPVLFRTRGGALALAREGEWPSSDSGDEIESDMAPVLLLPVRRDRKWICGLADARHAEIVRV
jgi:hypothetical protein